MISVRVSLLALLATIGMCEIVRCDELRIATFEVDATPPLGSPVAYAPARSIDDPLSARGVVLLGQGDPIVLCAVDFLGIGNSGYQRWRDELARAAGTASNRVALHTIHQHDAPRCDFDVEQLLTQHGMGGKRFDVVFCRELLSRVRVAVERALAKSQPVTHLGIGEAVVKGVASNRRILGKDGKVAIVRYSSSKDQQAIAAPEGVIDPALKMLSFWQDQQPLAVLSYYATHPQSYYGQGDVTCEFVGIARNSRQTMLKGLPHIHFNGASGNVAAGKYNDGSRNMRRVLAERMADGMRRAWQGTKRTKIGPSDVDWRVMAVRLPAADYLNRKQIQSVLQDDSADSRAKLMAAKELIWLNRCEAQDPLEISCLQIGSALILHMPGELFVEYQLAAQAMRPDLFVAMAAYGDYSPGYIGTAISYTQGGYEVRNGVSRVGPDSEQILVESLQQLMQASNAPRHQPSEIVQ